MSVSVSLCAPLFASVLALAPPAGEDVGGASVAAPEAASPGTLTIRPPAVGGLRVTDGDGRVIAHVSGSRRGEPVTLTLPAGDYFIFGDGDEALAKVEMSPRGVARWAHPDAVEPAPEPEPPPLPSLEAEGPRSSPSSKLAAPGQDEPADPKRPRWKRVVSPLLSALVPGVGQMVNREVLKGFGVLVGTGALLGGLWGLDQADQRRTAQQVGEATLSAGLGYLYIWQLTDAYAVAADKRDRIRPHTAFKLRVSARRMSTIAPSGRYAGTDLYSDWSFDLMGQPVRRFTLGVTDLSAKIDRRSQRTAFQFGGRFAYRVYDKKRLWVSLGAGALMQYAVAIDDPPRLDPEGKARARERRFGATPYGQLELRYFVVDRISLDLIPRLSVPLETRYYAGPRTLPRHAVTLEVGTGVGVVF